MTLQKLSWQAYKNQPLELGEFDARTFEDFIWTNLFAKSLKAGIKQLVTTARYRVIGPSRSMLHLIKLRGLMCCFKHGYLGLDTREYDFSAGRKRLFRRAYQKAPDWSSATMMRCRY